MRSNAYNRLQKGADFHELRNLFFHLLQLRRYQRIGAVMLRRMTFQPLQQADVIQREAQRTAGFDERQRVQCRLVINAVAVGGALRRR